MYVHILSIRQGKPTKQSMKYVEIMIWIMKGDNQ